MDLTQIKLLTKDWSLEGADAPNGIAMDNAKQVIDAIHRSVYDLKPSVEGGVFIQYKIGQFGAIIECYNSGEIGYTLTHYGKSVSSKDMVDQNVRAVEFISDIQNHLGSTELRSQIG